jgi:hypothetical protein
MEKSKDMKNAEKMLNTIANEISNTFKQSFNIPSQLKGKEKIKALNTYRNYQAKGTWSKLK